MLCSGAAPHLAGAQPRQADARCGKSETFRTSGGEAAEEMGCESVLRYVTVLRMAVLRHHGSGSRLKKPLVFPLVL